MNIHPLRSIALGVLLMLSSQTVLATPAEDARALMGRDQNAEALKKLDDHLARNPQDAEARFTRGLVLVKLNRVDDAIKVFATLTRDYPQLPEPYNNLAVLYAQQGNYEKARDALEAALATHPSYPTAHENLGDIYAALAGAAYNRALMLDQANQTVRSKLNLIAQLDHVPANALSSTRQPAPAPRQAAAPAAAPVAPAAPAAVAAAPAAPTVAAAPVAGADAEAINSLLLTWTKAWSSKDLDAYFGAYAEDFAPEGGLTRAAWQGQRRDRISRPKRISVSAVNVDVTSTGAGTAKVTFVQEYESDSFNDQVRKVLELRQVNGNWKITREYTR